VLEMLSARGCAGIGKTLSSTKVHESSRIKGSSGAALSKMSNSGPSIAMLSKTSTSLLALSWDKALMSISSKLERSDPILLVQTGDSALSSELHLLTDHHVSSDHSDVDVRVRVHGSKSSDVSGPVAAMLYPFIKV
jgi:hypothetical protein